jgi:phage gp36-like protein
MAAYLLAGDLDTHIYSEIRDVIVRDDADILTKAISEAVLEAKSYLSRYDLVKLFGSDDVEARDDEQLKSRVKDIAVWRLVRLANPNIEMALARTNYEDAVRWLKDIQKGVADPEGWPLREDMSPLLDSGNLGYSSNTKRRNHW